eukprot:SAG31_NODE_1628_length_7704_cov_27.599606_3_plen_978_part_00
MPPNQANQALSAAAEQIQQERARSEAADRANDHARAVGRAESAAAIERLEQDMFNATMLTTEAKQDAEQFRIARDEALTAASQSQMQMQAAEERAAAAVSAAEARLRESTQIAERAAGLEHQLQKLRVEGDEMRSEMAEMFKLSSKIQDQADAKASQLRQQLLAEQQAAEAARDAATRTAAALELSNSRADAMAEKVKQGAAAAETAAAKTAVRHGDAAACFREESVRAANELSALRERSAALERKCSETTSKLAAVSAALQREQSGRLAERETAERDATMKSATILTQAEQLLAAEEDYKQLCLEAGRRRNDRLFGTDADPDGTHGATVNFMDAAVQTVGEFHLSGDVADLIAAIDNEAEARASLEGRLAVAEAAEQAAIERAERAESKLSQALTDQSVLDSATARRVEAEHRTAQALATAEEHLIAERLQREKAERDLALLRKESEENHSQLLRQSVVRLQERLAAAQAAISLRETALEEHIKAANTKHRRDHEIGNKSEHNSVEANATLEAELEELRMYRAEHQESAACLTAELASLRAELLKEKGARKQAEMVSTEMIALMTSKHAIPQNKDGSSTDAAVKIKKSSAQSKGPGTGGTPGSKPRQYDRPWLVRAQRQLYELQPQCERQEMNREQQQADSASLSNDELIKSVSVAVAVTDTPDSVVMDVCPALRRGPAVHMDGMEVPPRSTKVNTVDDGNDLSDAISGNPFAITNPFERGAGTVDPSDPDLYFESPISTANGSNPFDDSVPLKQMLSPVQEGKTPREGKEELQPSDEQLDTSFEASFDSTCHQTLDSNVVNDSISDGLETEADAWLTSTTPASRSHHERNDSKSEGPAKTKNGIDAVSKDLNQILDDVHSANISDPENDNEDIKDCGSSFHDADFGTTTDHRIADDRQSAGHELHADTTLSEHASNCSEPWSPAAGFGPTATESVPAVVEVGSFVKVTNPASPVGNRALRRKSRVILIVCSPCCV